MAKVALYYPEWSINDPLFLAESLLYWDRLGCIVPDSGFSPENEVNHPNEEMQALLEQAHALYVSPVVPDQEQKERVGKRIEEFANSTPPLPATESKSEGR